MATTTNFGWTTPDDTGLVKDGASAIRTLGSAIDTSMVKLKGGTTGQILSKASNTDLDYAWIANDVGDITAVNAGTGISGGGLSGAVTITNDMATSIDAKGDLIVGTGNDTYSRLAVGTNGLFLKADSTASTGVAWGAAGGMTLISTTTLGSTTTTISSIPQTYKHLYVEMLGCRDYINGNAISMQWGGETSANYMYAYRKTEGTTASDVNGMSAISVPFPVFTVGNNGYVNLLFMDYANTTDSKYRTCQMSASYISAVAPTYGIFYGVSSMRIATTINSLTFFISSGTLAGTVKIYGVN